MQELKLKLRGLFTHYSDLSGVTPDGALSVADDITLDKEDLAEPRRGFNRSYSGLANSGLRADKLWFYQNYLFAHESTNNTVSRYSTVLSSNTANFTGSGTWGIVSGTFAAPTDTKVHTAEAKQNLYLTTSTGVYKWDAYNATPVLAGAAKGLDVTAVVSNITGNWLPTTESVAYRVVWGYKDANNALILGAPSQREIATNSAGADRAVALTITIPEGVTTSWIYQVYRSAATTAAEPSDELGLVYEDSPTSGQISAGLVTLNDIVPDDLRGATIYTAATQEGLAAGNEQPPLAWDLAVYKNCMFYGNTTSKHRLFVTLLAASGTNGLALNDTITIGSVAYTAKSTESVASREFKLYTAGSASQNIRDTAISLVRVINQSSSSVVKGYYVSSPDQLPGKMLFEAETLGSSAFTVTSSNTACWSPDLTSQTSTNDRYKNAVYYSKPDQPEAVPLGNFFYVGSADKNILRILPLRDSLFILKEDGIYRLSGEDSSSFRVDLFDSTARLVAPETAVVLNNQIMCLTDQGVVAITESGVQVKSRPIESTLTDLNGINPTVLKASSFGISYETERKYILFVPKLAGDTTPTQAFVYNTFTNTWVRWLLTKTAGVVHNTDDKLYLAEGSSQYVNQERKNLDYSDYVDYGFATNITAVSGTTLTVSNADNISAGDVIYQSSTVFATVASVNTSISQVTLDYSASFTVASTDVLKAISTKIAWVPITGSNPGILKQFREVTLLFKKDFTGTATISFTSDTSPAAEQDTISGTAIGLWGLFGWGLVPWGGSNTRKPYRLWVPRNKQRSSYLTVEFRHSTGYARYQFNGASVIFNVSGERVNY
jgi:hypothetical protein